MGDTRVKSGLEIGGRRGREGRRPARSCRHDTSLDAGVYQPRLSGPGWACHCNFLAFTSSLPPHPGEAVTHEVDA